MNVAVLGASGRTGRAIVAELLRRNHDVAVLARDPDRIDAPPTAVRVVVGDSRDRGALRQLVAGTDAVVSALGPVGKDAALHRDTAAALIPVMQEAGVVRFVGISGAGIDVPGDRKTLPHRLISFLIQRLGGPVVADKPAEYAAWAASDREWTLVRPPRLVDGARSGRWSTTRTALRRAPRSGGWTWPPSSSTWWSGGSTWGRRRS